MNSTEMPVLSWTKDNNFFISTEPSLVPLDQLNDNIFAAEDFYWGKPLPPTQLQTLVQRSLCFGIYELASWEQSTPSPTESGPQRPPRIAQSTRDNEQSPRRLIGFARLITDLVTVHYLTDVYILPRCRKLGLGIWLMSCIDEVFKSNEHLRGMILIADRGSRTETFYRKYLGMGDLGDPAFCMDRKGSCSA